MADDDKYASTVAKLFKKAESTDNEHEREAFMEKAYELMERHSIDAIMLAKANGDTAPVREKLVFKKYDFTGVYALAMTHLLHSIAKALDCETVQWKRRIVTIEVCGFEADIERLDFLMATLSMQINRAVDVYIAQKKREHVWDWLSASEKYNAKRSFMWGFGDGVHAKLVRAKKKIVAEEVVKGTGAELVLVDRKKQVDVYYRDRHPKVTPGRGIKLIGSHKAGHAAGLASNTGENAIGGSRPAIRGW